MKLSEWLRTQVTYLPNELRDELSAPFKGETDIVASVIDLRPQPTRNAVDRQYWWLTQDRLVLITIQVGPVEGANVRAFQTNVQSRPLTSILGVEKQVAHYSEGYAESWVGEGPRFTIHFRPDTGWADVVIPPADVTHAETLQQYQTFGRALFEKLI